MADLRAAVAAGVALGGGAPSVAPGDRRGRSRNIPREGGVGLPLRRRDGRARLRGGRRRGVGHAYRAAPPIEYRHCGLGSGDAAGAGSRRRGPGSALGRTRDRRQDRLRAQGTDGRATDPRGGGSRRPQCPRPAAGVAVHAPGDGALGALRKSGGDRARSAQNRGARRRFSRTGTATPRCSRGSRRISTRSRGSAAPPASSCSGRWRHSSNTEAGLSPASATLEMRLRQST